MAHQVVASAPFRTRLREIRTFFAGTESAHLYTRLLDDLEGTIIPNLRTFPQVGRPWFEEGVQSTEALMALARLPRNAAQILRKYVHDDFVILYALLPDTVHLISIRHHRESTFQP